MILLNKSRLCPCGSQSDYSLCCRLYIDGKENPPSPEALMRSRYTAYALADIKYIKRTMRGKPLMGFNEAEAKSWAERVTWLGLKVIRAENDSPKIGFVEFIANFMDGAKLQSIHEVSEFHLEEGQWFYVDGFYPSSLKNYKNKKVSRNDLCPCGSRKKFKNCHGAASP